MDRVNTRLDTSEESNSKLSIKLNTYLRNEDRRGDGKYEKEVKRPNDYLDQICHLSLWNSRHKWKNRENREEQIFKITTIGTIIQ